MLGGWIEEGIGASVDEHKKGQTDAQVDGQKKGYNYVFEEEATEEQTGPISRKGKHGQTDHTHKERERELGKNDTKTTST